MQLSAHHISTNLFLRAGESYGEKEGGEERGRRGKSEGGEERRRGEEEWREEKGREEGKIRKC